MSGLKAIAVIGVVSALVSAFKDSSSIANAIKQRRKDKEGASASTVELEEALAEGEQEIQEVAATGIRRFGPYFVEEDLETKLALQAVVIEVQASMLRDLSIAVHDDSVTDFTGIIDASVEARMKAVNILTGLYLRKQTQVSSSGAEQQSQISETPERASRQPNAPSQQRSQPLLVPVRPQGPQSMRSREIGESRRKPSNEIKTTNTRGPEGKQKPTRSSWKRKLAGRTQSRVDEQISKGPSRKGTEQPSEVAYRYEASMFSTLGRTSPPYALSPPNTRADPLDVWAEARSRTDSDSRQSIHGELSQQLNQQDTRFSTHSTYAPTSGDSLDGIARLTYPQMPAPPDVEPAPSETPAPANVVLPLHTVSSVFATQSVFEDSAIGTSIRTKEAVKSMEHEDDTRSVLSNSQDLSIPADMRDDLVTEFADVLYQRFCDSMQTAQTLSADLAKVIANSLPDILRDFSMQLEPLAHSEAQKKAILLVRRYRIDIATRFSSHMEVNDMNTGVKVSDLEQHPDARTMTVEEKLRRWSIEYGGAVEEQQHIPKEVTFTEAQQFQAARAFLLESTQFQWLLGRLRAACSISMKRDSPLELINKAVASNLARVAPLQLPSAAQKATFKVAWDPLTFILEQGYPIGEEMNLNKVITINGSARDAQALTCAQYMDQTWPATGVDLLGAIQSAMANGRHVKYQSRLLSDVELSIAFEDAEMLVHTVGSRSLLAEIAAQLGWLCAACRAGPHEAQMALCEPQIAVLNDEESTFHILVLVRSIEHYETAIRANGSCWHGLFRNAVIVTGAPIAVRPQNEQGLEIPLNMMAGLGGASHATVFDEVVLMKGHSAMFIPTARTRTSAFWHFVYCEDGSRIPFGAASCSNTKLMTTNDFTIHDLEKSRHFLGWTSIASLKTGTEQVKYNSIRFSGLDFVGKGCAFERVTISGGMYVTGGASFVRGSKDTPLHLSFAENTYEQQIWSARSTRVVMYDVGDRRAWLLDGASALLHLTRTQLETPPFDQSSEDILQKFQYARTEDKAEAAWMALTKADNRNLPIFTNTETWTEKTFTKGDATIKEETKTKIKHWCFQNLVQRTWYVLEQIIDHQSKLLAAPSIGLRFTDREKLEGFEFLDIVRGKNPLTPRVAILKSSGRGWVDLVRGIGAICLLGRGFGDLIVPRADSRPFCRLWTHVPKGKDYLAALVSTIHSICEEYGDENSSPLRIARGVYWHQARGYLNPANARLQEKTNLATQCKCSFLPH